MFYCSQRMAVLRVLCATTSFETFPCLQLPVLQMSLNAIGMEQKRARAVHCECNSDSERAHRTANTGHYPQRTHGHVLHFIITSKKSSNICSRHIFAELCKHQMSAAVIICNADWRGARASRHQGSL